MAYLSSLSRKQLAWFGLTVLCMVGIVGVGLMHSSSKVEGPTPSFTTDMTIRQIAGGLGVTGKNLAREFGLPLDVPKKQPLRKLGITEAELDHVIHHLLGHRDAVLKYYLFGALTLWGFVFLTRLGRPDGSPAAERRTWYPCAPYIAALIIAVTVCGFALGKVLAFLFFLGLAVIGNKLICGWACPFGALQELLYALPILRNMKRRKVPFRVSNTIRAVLFLLTLLFLFGIVGGRKGFVIYHFVNPFNLFNLDWESVTVVVTIVTMLALSLGVYRPFCQFICPFGFLSWTAERISLFRVRVDPDRCTHCGACVKACPLDAAQGIVEQRTLAADCFSCGRCLNVCPQDAIAYQCVFGKRSAPEQSPDASSDAIA